MMINGDARDDNAYHAKRARQEREMARLCGDTTIGRVHLTLAEAYERQLRDDRPRLALAS